jgi:hypothetical protein
MLDLLFLPAALAVAYAFRAVHRGEYRLHGHLMASAFTLMGLRLLLQANHSPRLHLNLWLGALGLAGATLLLGRQALAWREGRSWKAALPRLHRTAGILTLITVSLVTLAWLLRPNS